MSCLLSDGEGSESDLTGEPVVDDAEDSMQTWQIFHSGRITMLNIFPSVCEVTVVAHPHDM